MRYLGRRNVEKIAVALPPQAAGRESICASFVAEGAITGTFETTIYQDRPERPLATNEVVVPAAGFDAAEIERGIARGTAIGEAVNLARRLAVTPANDMTPTHMAEARARKSRKATDSRSTCSTKPARAPKGWVRFSRSRRAACSPRRCIVMRYSGDPSSKEVLALVGKGITFDSGGISIKPAERMQEMKYDMSGGAGVIAAM